MKKIKTVFVTGPTASGKTALAVELAKRFCGEIISADSMQIYKGIHIASAAPDEDEKCGVVHHLTEFLNVDEQFSVADFVKAARSKIRQISSQGKLPIVAGGTGLYISSLLDNINYTQEETDYELRNRFEEKFDRIGGEKMLEELGKFDAETAKRLHPNNRRRIIRAFEVYSLTGKTVTEQNILSKSYEDIIEPLVLGITFSDREKLYERINKRVDIMLRKGLCEEAARTYKNGGSTGGFQAIGHKELYGYFDGTQTLAEAAEHLKQQTRRYAKRQLTWFRRDDRIHWLYPDLSDSILNEAVGLTEQFLKE